MGILAVTLVLGLGWMTAPLYAEEAALRDIQQLVVQRQYQPALAQLDALIAKEPSNAEARFLRGVIFAQTGRVERAIAVFKGLTEQFPDLSEPYNNLAVLYASRSDYDNARHSLLKAIELEPNYATAYENLGDIYSKLAGIAYDKAYTLSGTNDRARAKARSLAEMLERVNNRRDYTVPTKANKAAETPAPQAEETTAHAPAAPAAPAQTPTAIVAACYRIGPLPDPRTGAIIGRWFRSRGIQIEEQPENTRLATGFKVYIPPRATRAEAIAVVSDLKSKGIKDVLVMGEPELRNGISVGVFSQQASVQRRVKQMETLGYETRVQPRYADGNPVTWFQFSLKPEQKHTAEEYREAFPEYALQSTACAQD